MTVIDGAPLTLEGWHLVRRMLDDLTVSIEGQAETELELLEGLRVLGRATALCSELSLDVDAESPWFFPMNGPVRLIGGPNPDGEYYLSMIDGHHRYRVRGGRGSSAYLGFQVLAGVGLTPRHMAAYISDYDLQLAADGSFAFVLAPERPTDAELGGDPWVAIPDDASAVVVREYIGDRRVEVPAALTIEPLDAPGRPALPTDALVGEQMTGMAWTIAKLTTLHQTIKPELLDQPNELVTARGGRARCRGLHAGQPLHDRHVPTHAGPGAGPRARAAGHALLERHAREHLARVHRPRRRRSSITNAAAVRGAGGRVRIVAAGEDPHVENWIDTGGRHRGFLVLRWLDNPDPPPVTTRVVRIDELEHG